MLFFNKISFQQLYKKFEIRHIDFVLVVLVLRMNNSEFNPWRFVQFQMEMM